MEVKINREIRNYTEAMFFGLSMRQFIFSACACVVAVGLYFLLKPYVGTETVSWMCILGAAPYMRLQRNLKRIIMRRNVIIRIIFQLTNAPRENSHRQ